MVKTLMPQISKKLKENHILLSYESEMQNAIVEKPFKTYKEFCHYLDNTLGKWTNVNISREKLSFRASVHT